MLDAKLKLPLIHAVLLTVAAGGLWDWRVAIFTGSCATFFCGLTGIVLSEIRRHK